MRLVKKHGPYRNSTIAGPESAAHTIITPPFRQRPPEKALWQKHLSSVFK